MIPALAKLWPTISYQLSADTGPEGADLYYKTILSRMLPGKRWARRR